MKLGALFPQTEIGNDPVAIKDFAQAIEDLDYEHLATYEHVLGANSEGRSAKWVGPYTYKHAFHEPFVLLGYLAGFTRKLVFMPSILILPQRQTALVAKQAAEVDVLSSGRLRLGVGVGWNSVESEALGQDFHTRGARIEEQIKVLRALWTNELVTFEGRWHKIRDVGINPLPAQRPIPIWMGGESDAAIRRAGRLADGFVPGGGILTEFKGAPKREEDWLPKAVELMRSEARTAGRNAKEIPVVGFVPAARQRTPQEWDHSLKRWRAVGAEYLRVNTMGAGWSPSQHIEMFRQFREYVIQNLQSKI